MNARIWLAVPAFALAIGVAQHRSPYALAAAPAAAGGQDTSTLDDQNELALTVYNSDLALVRDVRTLQLPRGTFDLKFMDIAATVNPATVHFRSLSEPSMVRVLEQNYEYDLLEPDKLLRKYVGRAGAVLTTTDGLRFARVNPPAAIDLVSVAATDARSATVTAIDGRRFHTADQGATWTPQ